MSALSASTHFVGLVTFSGASLLLILRVAAFRVSSEDKQSSRLELVKTSHVGLRKVTGKFQRMQALLNK